MVQALRNSSRGVIEIEQLAVAVVGDGCLP